MLHQMNSTNLICSILPKFKHQLAFLHARQLLFDVSTTTLQDEQENIMPIQTSLHSSTFDLHSSLSSSQKPLIETEPIETMSITTQSTLLPPFSSLNTEASESTIIDRIPLPLDYDIPDLPTNLLHDIENGDLKEFGPHRSYRRVLIDAVFFDLTNNHSMW